MRTLSSTNSAVSDTETRRAFFYDEHRHGMARITCFGGNEIQIGVYAIGNKHLGAIEHPVIAIALGRGANARHVGACAGL
jgi:hypothetical protein